MDSSSELVDASTHLVDAVLLFDGTLWFRVQGVANDKKFFKDVLEDCRLRRLPWFRGPSTVAEGLKHGAVHSPLVNGAAAHPFSYDLPSRQASLQGGLRYEVLLRRFEDRKPFHRLWPQRLGHVAVMVASVPPPQASRSAYRRQHGPGLERFSWSLAPLT
jgi:hypothetical protein